MVASRGTSPAHRPSGKSGHDVSAPSRYLGLELSGAKSDKTTLAALEYYPREKKTFLLDIHERMGRSDRLTADENLLEVIDQNRANLAAIAVNVPLTLPPCLECTRKVCPHAGECNVAAIKWMRDTMKRVPRRNSAREFTAYTQRPIELWVRHHVFPELAEKSHFEIDESFGGNKAPLAARMHFLKRHLRNVNLLEVWPKLTVAMIAERLDLPARFVTSYRDLEKGAHSRLEILEPLIEHFGVFVYEKDVKTMAQNLSAFDAFVCAFTGLLSDLEECEKPPKGFPIASGWVQYPKASHA